jgi:hypothetical protein
MTDETKNNLASQIETKSIFEKVVDSTPAFFLQICAVFFVGSLCIIAVLQFGGIAPSLQRMMNARASVVERQAERVGKATVSIEASANSLEGVIGRIEAKNIEQDIRIDRLEEWKGSVDRYHGRK